MRHAEEIHGVVGGPQTPATEAGRRLLDQWHPDTIQYEREWADILAIENEAAFVAYARGFDDARAAAGSDEDYEAAYQPAAEAAPLDVNAVLLGMVQTSWPMNRTEYEKGWNEAIHAARAAIARASLRAVR